MVKQEHFCISSVGAAIFILYQLIGGVQVQLESSEIIVSEAEASVNVCVIVTSGNVTSPDIVILSTIEGSATG